MTTGLNSNSNLIYNNWVTANGSSRVNNSNTTATTTTTTTSRVNNSSKKDKKDILSLSTNTGCTDGKDDGKIGLFSKIANTVKGVGKSAVNMVKSAIQHPLKTAALVGVCCIPVVGPVIAGGLAVYGLYNGVTTIASGLSAANSATTDAEAKEAWQNIGNGTFTTAASALALKGSTGTLKSQLIGGKSTTVNQLRAGQLKGENAFGTIKNVAKAGLKETGTNIKAVGTSIKETGKKGIEKVKQGYNSIKENGLAQTAKNTADSALTKIENTAKSAKSKITEKYDTYTNAKDMASQAKLDGGTVETYSNGMPKKITFENGEVWEYSRSGNITKTTSTESLGKYGSKTTAESGNTTTTEIRTTDSTTGETKSVWTEKENSLTNIKKTKSLSETSNGAIQATKGKYNSNTGSGYNTRTTLDGSNVSSKTTYTYGGNTYSASELSAIQKGIIRLDSGNVGSIVNAKLPVSDKALMYSSTLVNNDEN